MAATNAAQSNLQVAMENDDLLSHTMPEVIRVRYLGDSYHDYLAGFVGDSNGLSSGGASSVEKEDYGGDAGLLWGVLGGMMGVLLILFLALLFV